MNLYTCENGIRIGEATIKRNYSEALALKHAGRSYFFCEGCMKERAANNSHIIAKARCKVIHKTNLIWHLDNFFNACMKCHAAWEDLKTGDWLLLKNVEHCLAFLKEHDPEGFQIRVNLTEMALLEKEKNNL